MELTGSWCVVSIGGEPVGGVTASMEFTSDGQVRGFSGANQFSGTYQTQGDRIEFGRLVSTLMAGPDDANRVEQHLYATLTGEQTFSVDDSHHDGVLTIGADDGAVALRRAGPAASDVLTVSGTVVYRQRIALPPGVTSPCGSVTSRSPMRRPSSSPSRSRCRRSRCRSHSRSASSARRCNRGTGTRCSAQITLDGQLLWTSTDNIPVSADTPGGAVTIMLTQATSETTSTTP